MINLTGKVALVTGGSRGIGKAVCRMLAKQGSDLAINFHTDEAAAAATVEEIKKIGRKVISLKADVAKMDQVRIMVDQTVSELGGLDILVNNAGINRDNLLVRMKEDDWDQVIATNLKGTFNCSREVIKVMIKNRQGSIINLSSVVAITGNVGQANYTAAKAGIIGFTKTAARELASRKIRVNVVAPGFINTEMTAKLPDEARAKIAAKIPLGYFGEPDDIANIIAFLASDEASYITGQVIVIDGGLAI